MKQSDDKAVPHDKPFINPREDVERLVHEDEGPWRANCSEEGGKVWIDSDDFEHDVRLVVSGDFESSLSKYLYARNLAERMNQMPKTGTSATTK